MVVVTGMCMYIGNDTSIEIVNLEPRSEVSRLRNCPQIEYDKNNDNSYYYNNSSSKDHGQDNRYTYKRKISVHNLQSKAAYHNNYGKNMLTNIGIV